MVEFDATTISLLIGALITVIGVFFGVKGITIKDHAKKFATSCAAVFDLFAAQDGAPTPAQMEAYYIALKQVIADAFVLGNDFGDLFTPAQAATMQKMNMVKMRAAAKPGYDG